MRVTLALDKAECQASQGEYAKAIDGLKAAAATEPKNADLPARLADLYLTRGDWEAAEAAMRRGREARSRPLAGAVGRGAAARAARRAREGRRRLEVVRRSLQREERRRSSRRPRRCSWSVRPPSATTAPARGARS